MSDLTDAQRAFLKLLEPHSKSLTRKHLPLADRAEDRVRQSCKRKGWAKFSRWQNDTRIGWRITTAGRKILAQSEDARKKGE